LGKPAVSPQQRRPKIQQTQLTEQQQPATSSSPPHSPFFSAANSSA